MHQYNTVVVVPYLSSGFSTGCAGPLAAVDWLRGSNCCPGWANSTNHVLMWKLLLQM